MKQPNLFNYATSELSQDAFFCWLLSWADDNYKNGSAKSLALNSIARDLLSLFLSKSNLDLPDVVNVEIFKQDGNIDILCIINKKYCIIIEDKVGTTQHSNQLSRYKSYIEEKAIYSLENIVPIYLQTRDQGSYKEVESDGFRVVRRKDILNILTKKEFADVLEYSDILHDYTAYLENIENAVNSFKTEPMNQWAYTAWVGFYLAIQEKFADANWGYVANPSGGFMGFWCFTHNLEKMDVYLQIEEQKICFKVAVDDDINRSETRNYLLDLFATEAKDYNLKVVKPVRFGTGTYMTFAILENGFEQAQNADGLIDIDKALNLMKNLEDFITHCINIIKKA